VDCGGSRARYGCGLGATAWWSSPAEISAYRASEEKRLGDIIRKAKITLD